MASLEITTGGFGDFVGELKQIWAEIGESKEDMDRMVLELESDCRQIYLKKIEEAGIARAHLHHSVAAKEAEVASLVAVLDERNLHRKMEKLSLKQQLASVNPLLEVLRQIREERSRQFTDVQSQIEKIKAEVEGTTCHHPQTNAVEIEQEERDLSIRRLTEYQLQLKELQKNKSDRLQKVLESVNEIYSLCGLLQEDFRKTVDSVHPSLHDNGGKHSTNISDSTLEGLSQAILKLETEKKIRKQKLSQAARSLMDLWNMMEMPVEDRKYYGEIEIVHLQGSPEHDYSLDTIEKLEAEVERLINLKETRIRELVLIKRAELEEICRTAHIQPDSSTISAIDSGVVSYPELLANIEMQISKAKEETVIRKEIMDGVSKWLAACDEESWLEDYDQDPNKYIAGRGFHLNLKRAEKARATVNKISDMVDKLMNKVFVWEIEKRKPFLYDGVSLVSILEEYKLLRLQKQELKRRYREQRKLQNLFPTGSKLSSRRNNNFLRKPNENGSMTPAPQWVTVAGNANPELLIHRSRSRSRGSGMYSKEMPCLPGTSLNFGPMSGGNAVSLFTSITSSEPESPLVT